MVVSEDILADAVMRRLVQEVRSLSVYQSDITGGVTQLKAKLKQYRNASKVIPHVICLDLDDNECAPSLLKNLGITPRSPSMLVRVAVREVESWLLADTQGLAEFLNIPMAKVPNQPDTLRDPKLTLINLARKSKNKSVREGIVPEQGARASVGPLYNPLLASFVNEGWSLLNACTRSPSLEKALLRLREFQPS